MSIIAHHSHRLDTYIDRLQLHGIETQGHHLLGHDLDQLSAPSVSTLAAATRALSTTSPSGSLLGSSKILDHLQRVSALRPSIREATRGVADGQVAGLVWAVAAKASVQTFGCVLTTLLEETVPLSDGIWYWDEVLGSYFCSGLYTVQTAPLRWAHSAGEIYRSVRQSNFTSQADLVHSNITERWRTFYRLVRHSIWERSLLHAKQVMLSPFQLCRTEARSNRRGLKRLREMNACAVGLLMEEGLLFDIDEEEPTEKVASDDWQDIISRTTLLMQTVLQHVNVPDTSIMAFEDNVFASVERGIEVMELSLAESEDASSTDQAYQVIDQLINILGNHLPVQQELSRALAGQHDRPSRLIRYWIPAVGFLFSSSTILNILTNRRAQLVTWVHEAGLTAADFWKNWIVEPLSRLVGTIRHNEKSEVALMSRNSLDADLASLERMVIDFAVQHVPHESGTDYTPDALEGIRQGVREGDLTPVLKAYERDLQRPFVGAVRGDLVTALLIQIQKTKVDVEIAISGINSLLKSQELVFAFIGLTPSILISYSALQWMSSLFGSRRGLRQGQKRREFVRSLRSVNRLLTSSSSSPTGVLSYKEHGLLICEVEPLRNRAYEVLPGVIYHEFHEDLNDLLNVRTGVARQLKVVEQIRWTYAKWIY